MLWWNRNREAAKLRKAAKYHGPSACLMCSHVAQDIANTKIVSNAKSEMAAMCSLDCPNFVDGEGLALVHTSHLIRSAPDLLEIFAIPENFCAVKNGHDWRYEYDWDGEYAEFLAVPPNHDIFNVSPETKFLALITRQGELFIEKFDSALRAVPIWHRKPRQSILRRFPRNTSLASLSAQELYSLCKEPKIDFLIYNYLESEETRLFLAHSLVSASGAPSPYTA